MAGMLLARRAQANTKAEVVVAERRAEPEAVRRPTITGGVVPTAATEHAGRARVSPTRVRHSTTRIIAIPVLTPLPNIAVHVIQAPSIRFFAADGMTCLSRVSTEPSVIAELRVIITKTVLCSRACPTRVLPLSFSRELINSAGGSFFRQTLQFKTEFNRVCPRNSLHGIPRPLKESGVRTHDFGPLLLGHFMNADLEVLA